MLFICHLEKVDEIGWCSI